MGYEKRQFLYGMDFDTEERLVKPGFSRKNINVRIGSSSDNGVYSAENVQGNTFIPNVELPEGDNKVIGSYLYKKKNLVYIFIWNDAGTHGIYEYNHESSKIVTVMQASVFNFNSDSLITGINVVEFDDSNDLLYWVDKSNPPRKININKAKLGGYILPIKEEVVDAVKYPPLFPPTVNITTDSDYKVNYIRDKIFQFKAAYVYDDKEVSAWSSISLQSLPSSTCGGEESQGNTIKIKIPIGGELVERIKIAAREGNVNDFFQISDDQILNIDVSEYTIEGDYIVYEFRNDKAPQSIELNQSIKLFDNLPQVAGAQEFIKNKITYADITEGYDNVDVDFGLSVSYETSEEEETLNTISGVLRIAQPMSSNTLGLAQEYVQFQPIHKYNGEIQYGGFGDRNRLVGVPPLFVPIPDEFVESLVSDFKQALPLGGFCLYLAGTDFHTISTQVRGLNSDIQEGEGLYYDSSDWRTRKTIREEIKGGSSGLDNYSNSRTWSTWSFDNIPDGTYILRVASNLTTSDDLLDSTRGYQKTSAFLNRIGNGRTTSHLQTNQKELEVTVQGGQILDNIEVVIADLSDPGAYGTVRGLAGYITDFEDNFSPTSISDVLGQKRIELATANVERNGSWDARQTDHNGFFWNVTGGNKKVFLNNVKSGLFQENDQAGYDMFSGSFGISAIENTTNGTVNIFAINNNAPPVTSFSRTNVLITVEDQDGNGVSGVTVVSTNGDIQTTKANGQAPFIIYAAGGSDSRTVEFYPYLSGSCKGEFTISTSTFNDYIGQNTANNDSTTTIIPPWILTITTSFGSSALKNGGTYSYGIVYYDRANRSGNTNIISKSELVLPFYTEGSSDGSVIPITSPPIVTWSIDSVPPSWATHYQWVRTPNTSLNNYLQWYTNDITYSVGGTNSNDASIINLDITNLTDEYKVANPDSVLVYDYSSKDRIRFIKDSAGTYFEEYLDVKVLGFEAGILKVDNSINIDITDGVFFEIYTPKLDVSTDIYYEIGECYEVGKIEDILSPGSYFYYHKGSTSDQILSLGVPATGTFKSGDTYYRNRDINTSDVTDGIFTTMVDSQLFSDFWQSKISDIGRPNVVDKNAKNVTRPTTIYHSGNFIPETNVNGLNSFFDSSFQTYDRNYGAIRKLFGVNGRLDVYHELNVTKVLVEESIVFNQADQGNIGISNTVLSYPAISYAGDYGTLNPESFTENNGRRYFFDVRNGKVLRLSNDGLTPISENLMHSYFESKSNFYSVFNIIPEVWGVYDENHDEYIISFGSISREEGFTPDELALVSSQAETVVETREDGQTYTFDIQYSGNEQGVPTDFTVTRDVENGVYVINSVAGDIVLGRQTLLSVPAETLAFSERTKYWTTFYTFTPECMVRVGLDYLTFRNGETHLHNTNKKRNSFYGLDSSVEIWAVFNQAPGNNKVFQALSEESDTVWEAREILTQNGQKSSLIKDDFKVSFGQGHTLYSKENIHYAALWKDENTPNVDIPLLEGDSMRDVSVLVKIVNGSTEEERLFALSMNYSNSERSNK
jgi:hypothetical protein